MVLAISASVRAQEFVEQTNGMKVVRQSADAMNIYGSGGNPAWLFFSQEESALRVHLSTRSSTGGYHRPFEPGYENSYEYCVEGARELAGRHAVKGQFGFQQELRGDWRWMSTKSYDNGSPFLLADSTVGATSYSGIVLSGIYSVLLSDGFVAGAQLNYGVNNGLKEVSPKPTSTNRDLSTILGVAYILDKTSVIGLMFKYADRQEEIVYQVDQGAISQQTILYKFRGIDSYLRVTNNTETRRSQFRSYRGIVNIAMNVEENTAIVADGGGGVETISLTDGGTSPISQGYWQNSIGEIHLRAQRSWNDLIIAAAVEYLMSNQWARHPMYDVTLMKRSDRHASFGIGSRFSLAESWKLAGEYLYTQETDRLDDFISVLTSDARRTLHEISAGAEWDVAKETALSLYYSFGLGSGTKPSIAIPSPTQMYVTLRSREFDYFRARTLSNGINAGVRFNGGFLGRVACTARVGLLSVDNTAVFKGTDRRVADFSVNFLF